MAMAAHHQDCARARTIQEPCSESGFTLIELVVAGILLALVVGVAASTIIQGFKGAADTAATAGGRSSAAEAAERLGADVRGARSTGRDGAKIVDVAELADVVREDDAGRVGVLYDISGNVLDWRDLTEATPNSITFQSDVVDEVGGAQSIPECVTWYVADAAGGWYLRRVARAYSSGCSGGGRIHEDDAMTHPTRDLPRPGTSGAPALFSFVVASRSGGGCASRTSAGPLSRGDRNRTLGVRIDFSSLARNRDQAGRAALRDEFAIRSRAASDYQLALGCDEG